MERDLAERRLMESYFDRLWPLCRSIMGPGYRDSLRILEELVPFQRISLPTGTQVFDWMVPEEWIPRDAYFIDPLGKRHCEFKQNNLHLLNYSAPFRGRLQKEELEPHLFSAPDLPEAIPYVTSYYKKRWGFCLSHQERLALPRGEYEVVIDTEHRPGELVLGEAVLPGSSEREIFFSTYLCHPSMANNELSGPLALSFLYRRLKSMPKRKFTYRFLISAETIGTIAYLSQRGEHLKKHVTAGYQLTCLGDPGPFTLKTSRQETALSDRMADRVLGSTGEFRRRKFDPADGSDERQYCSQGFNLPVSSICRTMYAEYPEYHTSLDNRDFIRFEALQGSVDLLESLVREFEAAEFFRSTAPACEPQLGRRGLYPSIGGAREIETRVRATMWTLNYSDGCHDLKEISRLSGCELPLIQEVARELSTHALLERV